MSVSVSRESAAPLTCRVTGGVPSGLNFLWCPAVRLRKHFCICDFPLSLSLSASALFIKDSFLSLLHLFLFLIPSPLVFYYSSFHPSSTFAISPCSSLSLSTSSKLTSSPPEAQPLGTTLPPHTYLAAGGSQRRLLHLSNGQTIRQNSSANISTVAAVGLRHLKCGDGRKPKCFGGKF